MSVRLRPLLAAGAIALVILLAHDGSPPSPRTGAQPPAKAATPLAPASRTPAPCRSPVPTPTVGEAECRELFNAGRFADLLLRASDLGDETEQARWLDACARLAPPPLLAEHALRLPLGPTRTSLLDEAFKRWVLDSPIAFGRWAVEHLADDHSLDSSLARIIEHTDTVHRPTSAALAWVGLIHDPALRSRALEAVVREWAGTDPAAALRFAETAPNLSPDERVGLLALFVPPVTET